MERGGQTITGIFPVSLYWRRTPIAVVVFKSFCGLIVFQNTDNVCCCFFWGGAVYLPLSVFVLFLLGGF